MVEAVKLRLVPWQIVVTPEIPGADGIGFTTACKVAAGLLHPLTVTVAEYVPAYACDIAFNEGFC